MNAILSKDHLGQLFPSLAAMARHWGLSPCIVWERIDAGWDMEEALTTPPIKPTQRRCSFRKDHEGNDFDSTTAMCRHYKIKHKTFLARIQRHWTLKDALTTPRYQHIKESA